MVKVMTQKNICFYNGTQMFIGSYSVNISFNLSRFELMRFHLRSRSAMLKSIISWYVSIEWVSFIGIAFLSFFVCNHFCDRRISGRATPHVMRVVY